MNRRHFLLAALACACAAPVWAAPNLDDLKAAGGLRVALYRDFPPYSWQEAGEMRGIDADLARAIGRELGLKVTFMPLTPADDVDGDLRNAIWKGHYLGGGTADACTNHEDGGGVRVFRRTAAHFAQQCSSSIVHQENGRAECLL